MLKLVDSNDHRAVRNLNNIVDLHEVMINQRRPAEAVAQFLDPGYIQHDPLLTTGAEGLSSFFDNVLKDRPHARWVGHRVIAVDDYVWIHSNFLNLFNDDPDDTGIMRRGHFQDERRRQGDRALGGPADRRHSGKLGALVCAGPPGCQHERALLSSKRVQGESQVNSQ